MKWMNVCLNEKACWKLIENISSIINIHNLLFLLFALQKIISFLSLWLRSVCPLTGLWLLSALWMPIFQYVFFLVQKASHWAGRWPSLVPLKFVCMCVCMCARMTETVWVLHVKDCVVCVFCYLRFSLLKWLETQWLQTVITTNPHGTIHRIRAD